MLECDYNSRGDVGMRKVFFTVVYVVMSVAALIVASGAPSPWSGSGGGG